MEKITNMAYDSSYSIAQAINTAIGNSPLPFDSVYSICEKIYQKLGGTGTDFDSVYSILLEILPLVDNVGEAERMAELLISTGIVVKTTNTNQLRIRVEPKNNSSAYVYCNISAVVWGDGTYTETNGTEITGGDTENTIIGLGLQNSPCLTHTYTESGKYTVKVVGTQFYDTFDTDNGGTANIESVYIEAGVTDISVLVAGQSTLKSITFNDRCATQLGKYAFAYTLSEIENVYLPDNITFVSTQQFYNTLVGKFFWGKNLVISAIPRFFNYIVNPDYLIMEDLEIPYGVTTIGDAAFAAYYPDYIGTIKKLTLPSTLTTIQQSAFMYGLADGITIDMPSSVTSIGTHAFVRGYKNGGGSIQYTIISRNTTPPTCATETFYDINGGKPSACTLYVPNESLELYKAATGWKEFGTILPLEQYGNSVATNAEIDLIFEEPTK